MLIPFKEFGHDKEAFIKTNFKFENRTCWGKRPTLLLNETNGEGPFYFVVFENSKALVTRLFVFFYSKKELVDIVERGEMPLTSVIELDELIFPDNPLHAEFKQIGTSCLLRWNSRKYAPVLDKVTIRNVYTVSLMPNEMKVILKASGLLDDTAN